MIQSSTISTYSPDMSIEGPVIHSWDFHTCGQKCSHLSKPQISFLWGISLPLLGLGSDQNMVEHKIVAITIVEPASQALVFTAFFIGWTLINHVYVQDPEKG